MNNLTNDTTHSILLVIEEDRAVKDYQVPCTQEIYKKSGHKSVL